ncbi:cytochrome D1 domain-containing protein [Aquisalimonas sp.]|uniref:cytochrome D1 domain-containing protein n=1 Tax=Aquisalimonas sp. TaxID=1872621 RepID=UPI0025C2DDD7|nr:cytochrome D1 domain-containing protein [Aquisalimonas sp.]
MTTIGELRVGAALVAGLFLALSSAHAGELRGTGDLGVVIEREAGSLLVVESTSRTKLERVADLGDFSHASVKFSRDARHAFVFGRDGALSRIDLLLGELTHRVVQAGNSVGGGISQDGSLVAVSNYEPGGVRVFRTDDLEPIATIPAEYGDNGQLSKVVGLVDAPGQRFVFSLFDADEIWVADLSNPQEPDIRKFRDVGRQPYDGLITPDGRYYIAGLFGEDGLVLLDLWDLEAGVKRIMDGYGRGEEPLPVFKMPHLEGWAAANRLLFLPAVGRHELLVVNPDGWREVGRVPLHGQPIFAVARPDGRQIWVNFAYPDNDVVQVVDTATLEVAGELNPGPGVLHMEFTPRGEQLWLSVRDEDRVEVYDPDTLERLATMDAKTPSGIFMTYRAHRTGL